jgi:hypothetical protein
VEAPAAWAGEAAVEPGCATGCPPALPSQINGPPPEYDPSGIREYLADFATEYHTSDLSLSAFPDALAFDPTVAFAPGPVAHGDVSGGFTAKAWRARYTAGEVLLASTDGWVWAESPLFAVPGVPVSWIGLAFDGSGRAVVAAERASGPAGAPELWVYHFQPTVSGFVWESFGYGRCPVAVLDDTDPTNGDVQVLYIAEDGFVWHRQQRNRYALASATPLGLGPEGRLVRAGRVEGDRLTVWGVVRDATTGRWSRSSITSKLYPSRHGERMAFSALPVLGQLHEIPTTVPERMVFTAMPVGGSLRAVVFTSSQDERMVFTAMPFSGSLTEVVRAHAADERMVFTAMPFSGSLTTVVIAYPQDERMVFTAMPIGGVLESV